ncbi:type I-D CRISPR-associated helicase Cas3' [Crocosphaera sp. XPORK-15E]|uniref:type I-D CRISPR-associated helicase Cas3' n=1 Tax=Crocosphaera sp. XPORK-15E TaxID=3110247 RepID=UPI002B218FA7|nr:type I-D CRISPR-associated helicase Cas3' [Crocosphaera sp. XPORK-15E]MEA5536873.1 type I-D CRISPR-associated helicase Cas3' [Crocosphaera sp. XPORK-15E]
MVNQLQITLESASIAACPDIPSELNFMDQALQHQVDVYEAAKTNDIILDLAPTGTGKTKAGLSVLKHNPNRNAVYIAPTNALIEQQTKAAEEFVKTAGLPHIVKAASARHIKDWSNEKVGKRSGEKLYNVLREPATIFPKCKDQPILLVTNPDIFYYATFFAYNRLDKSNIASEFYSSFSTVIFDEFHLYDSKQLVSLFFYMALSQVFGYFNYNRKIILLTATPEPACDAALETLMQSGVKIKRIDGKEYSQNLIPSQTKVNLTIRSLPDEKEQLISEIVQEISLKLEQYPDQNGAVILDSKDTLNRIYDRLRAKGLEYKIGRIIGNTPSEQRQIAAQKQVILATSTVDVGFNFKKIPEPTRQNLDWLIFSTRDRFSFWQRIGRVGRVLGKQETNIISEVIAYLPEKAWEQGINKLDTSGGRKELTQILESLDCMKRPFLEVYWKSEAFLEIARPLIELENYLHNLEQESLINDLYHNLQKILGNNRAWNYYKFRMLTIIVAEKLALADLKPQKRNEWSFVRTLFEQSSFTRKLFLKKFLECNYPDLFDELNNNTYTIEELEDDIKKNESAAVEIQEFANLWKTIYSPLFRFRDSLFDNVKIYDPQYLLLDEVGETNLDPIHLLRYLEFETDGDTIELTARAKIPYNLTFSLTVEDLEQFNNTCLAKLYAFKNLQIKRMQAGSIRPTNFPSSLQKALQKTLIPGVIVNEHGKNKWAIAKLKKQGLDCYPIQVSDYASPKPKEYQMFPSLSGILAIAQAGFALRCPDNEDFYIV